MTERLVIHNFGPIQKAEMEIRDLTIFVGPQATGKSLAAQALYFLRGIESLPLPGSVEPHKAALSAMEWWFGNESSVYVKSGTLLSWTPPESIGEAVQAIQWSDQGVSLNAALEKRVQTAPSEQADLPIAKVYIPAGRSLYSFVPPRSVLSFRTEGWPGYMREFYGTLGRTIEWLWERQMRQGRRYSFNDTPEAIFLKLRIDSILKGQILYGPSIVLLETAQETFNPSTIASGQMETWPFWVIVEAGIQTGRLNQAQIYFDEPEAHLHPGAQRNMMEIVAYLTKRNTHFLLMTHSPYILYAINNFLMAQKVLDAGKNLPSDVPSEMALRPEQVAAYRFSSDGMVYDIMDAEVGLIDEDELDRVADELGETFGRLQERLEGVQ